MSKRGPNPSSSPNLVRVSAISKEDTEDTADSAALKQGIASFYDESSNLWESIWGEHMHHGYYETLQGNEGNENVDESNMSQEGMLQGGGGGGGEIGLDLNDFPGGGEGETEETALLDSLKE